MRQLSIFEDKLIVNLIDIVENVMKFRFVFVKIFRKKINEREDFFEHIRCRDASKDIG